MLIVWGLVTFQLEWIPRWFSHAGFSLLASLFFHKNHRGMKKSLWWILLITEPEENSWKFDLRRVLISPQVNSLIQNSNRTLWSRKLLKFPLMWSNPQNIERTRRRKCHNAVKSSIYDSISSLAWHFQDFFFFAEKEWGKILSMSAARLFLTRKFFLSRIKSSSFEESRETIECDCEMKFNGWSERERMKQIDEQMRWELKATRGGDTFLMN